MFFCFAPALLIVAWPGLTIPFLFTFVGNFSVAFLISWTPVAASSHFDGYSCSDPMYMADVDIDDDSNPSNGLELRSIPFVE